MENVTEKVKQIMAIIKKWVWVVIAGIVVGAVAWKAHIDAELGKQEQADKEKKVKEEAEAKLAEETAKLEAEKKVKEAQIEAEAKKNEEAIKASEAENKKKLEELAKKDKVKFKKEVEDKLGIKEKKKGRPKK